MGSATKRTSDSWYKKIKKIPQDKANPKDLRMSELQSNSPHFRMPDKANASHLRMPELLYNSEQFRRIQSIRFFSPYKAALARYIASLCEDNSEILDVGCDDGSVASMIMELNPSLKIVGIDVQSTRPPKIPRKIYDGKKNTIQR